MLKIGIIGTGHLGSIHLQNLLKITSIQVVGIFDTNLLHAQSKAAEYAVPCFATSEELLIAVDAVLIATPTLYHFGYIQQAIAANKHIFVEKPIAGCAGADAAAQGQGLDASRAVSRRTDGGDG